MLVSDVIEQIDKASPFADACGWDNVGLLVGDPTKEVGHIHIALDATDEVIDHAIEAGADMLVTHHPLIFSSIKRVVADDFIGRRIIRLIENNISYAAMHTNYDIHGMAELAADMMELTETSPLEVTSEDGTKGIGCIGMLKEEMTLVSFAKKIKEIFGLSFVNYFGEDDTVVRRVACTPGSGKSDIDEAVAGGADVYVTGDIDHHSGIDALARGLAIIDAGHYGIEHIFIEDEAARLKACLDDGVTITKEEFKEPIKSV